MSRIEATKRIGKGDRLFSISLEEIVTVQSVRKDGAIIVTDERGNRGTVSRFSLRSVPQ